MRKKIFLFIMILCFQFYGSTQSVTRSSADFSNLNEILPPSPAAASLGRYGGIEVNNSTGAVNKSISLRGFNYKALNVPITLNYISNGIRVNDLPGRTGMVWNLLAGGSVSKVVYGQDDATKTRLNPPGTYYNVDQESSELTTFARALSLGAYDSQPDIFSFNFNGYSGKFFFDHQGNIVQTPVSNLKITSLFSYGATYNFLIQTPDGVKYFFGGPDAIEKSKKGGNSSTFPSDITNVWHLNKIEHPSGYFISFAYNPSVIISSYKIGKTEAFYKAAFDTDDPLSITYTDPYGNVVTQYATGQKPPDASDDQYMTSTIRTLKSITTSDGGSVKFGYINTALEPLFNAITFYNAANEQIAKYRFYYDEVNTLADTWGGGEPLQFLREVVEVDLLENELNNGYLFDYYNKTAMPRRANFQQDHWGYYNGELNNTLIPTPTDPQLASWFPTATANREPNGLKAVNGLLSKITYPTGGRDEIEYESNVVSGAILSNAIVEVSKQITATTDTWEEQTSSFTVSYAQQVSLKISCSYTGTGVSAFHHNGGRVRLVRTSNGSVIFDEYFTVQDNNVDRYMNLESGSYSLYVSARGWDVKTEGKVTYRSGTQANYSELAIPVGGMRVKRVKTIDNLTNVQMINRFYYGKPSDLEVSTAVPIPKPVYYQLFKETVSLSDPAFFVTYKTYEHKSMLSNTINSMYVFSGGPVNYEQVTVSVGGDNFENGGMTYKYQIFPDIEGQRIQGDYIAYSPLTNSSYPSGRLLQSITYKNINGILKPQQEIIHEYEDEGTRRFKDVVCYNVQKEFAPLNVQLDANNNVVGPFPYVHLAYNVSRYILTSAWFYIKKTIEKTYDQNGLNPVEQVTTFTYDNDQHLQVTKLETFDSKSLPIKKELKYANEFAVPGNVYEDMVLKNIISPVVEEKFTMNGVLQTIQKNEFDNMWYPDKHVVGVKQIELQKAGYPNEIRYRYYKYDNRGNPLEMGKENDFKQSILWGTDNMPICQTINASQIEIAHTSFEEGTTSDISNWNIYGGKMSTLNSITGKQSFDLLNGSVQTANPLSSSVVFILSYWTKNSSAFSIPGTISNSVVTGRTINGWKYFEHKVTGRTNYSIAGYGLIDEIRLYPSGAQMVTNTFKLLVGQVSACDANNRITYYEYDDFGRLVLIRDENKNILKKYCYNYAGKIENCNIYYNIQYSQNFVKNDCGTGMVGGSVNYIVPEGKYSAGSTTDANAKAQADLAANGQAYANLYGECYMSCTNPDCTGNDKKCVNGRCETGVKVYTSSVQVHGSLWECTYHYEWSDGSWSQNYTESSSTKCVNIITEL